MHTSPLYVLLYTTWLWLLQPSSYHRQLYYLNTCSVELPQEWGGGGEVQAQILDVLQTWQSDFSPSQSQWERKREKKVTVTQGVTRTHNLANDLLCSNQLSYWVTRLLSGWVRILKAELPGIQLKQISSWHVRWVGCGERKARGTGSDFRHPPDLTVRL